MIFADARALADANPTTFERPHSEHLDHVQAGDFVKLAVVDGGREERMWFRVVAREADRLLVRCVSLAFAVEQPVGDLEAAVDHVFAVAFGPTFDARRRWIDRLIGWVERQTVRLRATAAELRAAPTESKRLDESELRAGLREVALRRSSRTAELLLQRLTDAERVAIRRRRGDRDGP